MKNLKASKKHVALVVGTRPDAIKMAPLIKALRQNYDLQVTLISTGQHRELLGQALESFGLKPDIDLSAMRPDQSLTELTAALIAGLGNTLTRLKPDLALGHGDTATCLAAAMASFFGSVPFAHVEAGLRSHDLNSPFPEEFNRKTVAGLARHHFAPDSIAQANLLAEGIAPPAISVTGNTLADAMNEMMKGKRGLSLPSAFTAKEATKAIVTITLHRREQLQGIVPTLERVRDLASERESMLFCLPVHPNPRVSDSVDKILGKSPNVKLLPPLAYPEFLALLLRSNAVITDSGGVQEEAALLGKQVLLLRNRTERNDGIEAGTTQLVGAQGETLREHLSSSSGAATPPETIDDTRLGASQRIADIVATKLLKAA